MNNCKVNQFVHTKYKVKMTVTDLDMIMHKKSKNHIRIVESKYPTEKENKTQDDVLYEIAKIFQFAIDNGYRNLNGVPKLEVLKIISTPKKICTVPHHYLEKEQDVYDIDNFKTINYLTKEEIEYIKQEEIDEFFLMEKSNQDNYHAGYKSYYPQKQIEIDF